MTDTLQSSSTVMFYKMYKGNGHNLKSRYNRVLMYSLVAVLNNLNDLLRVSEWQRTVFFFFTALVTRVGKNPLGFGVFVCMNQIFVRIIIFKSDFYDA